MSKKDYVDNWDSEMHETFCFWSFDEWKAVLVDAGFDVHPDSCAAPNPWIVENRLEGKVALYRKEDGSLSRLPWPETGMLLIGIKPPLDS